VDRPRASQEKSPDGVCPTARYYRAMTSGRGRIEELIAQLEQQRARLVDVRERARKQEGPESARLEAQAAARLREIEQRIEDLRTSPE
jgi:hypothetical protein